jgi:hypothetical protein
MKWVLKESRKFPQGPGGRVAVWYTGDETWRCLAERQVQIYNSGPAQQT